MTHADQIALCLMHDDDLLGEVLAALANRLDADAWKQRVDRAAEFVPDDDMMSAGLMIDALLEALKRESAERFDNDGIAPHGGDTIDSALGQMHEACDGAMRDALNGRR